MLPLLRASDWPGRVVNVASAAGRLRGSRDKTDALSGDALTMEALEELMRDFVRDAEVGRCRLKNIRLTSG